MSIMRALGACGLLCVALLLGGCPVYDPPEAAIDILNTSDSTVYVYQTCQDSIPSRPELELFDSFRQEPEGDTTRFSPSYKIESDSVAFFKGIRKGNQVACEDGKVRFFFISERVMRTKSWDEIYESQLYKSKVVRSQDELRRSNWVVTYNPQ